MKIKEENMKNETKKEGEIVKKRCCCDGKPEIPVSSFWTCQKQKDHKKAPQKI